MHRLNPLTERSLQDNTISESERYLTAVTFNTNSFRFKARLTMPSHCCACGESGFINVMRRVAMKGRQPNVKVIILYFPVRCIIHLVLKSRSILLPE